MAAMTSEVKFDLRFELSNLDYPSIHVHVASNCHIVDLRGHGSLQTASEVTNDLGIELSDLNYICCYVFLASICLHNLNDTEEEKEEEKWLPLISGAQRAPLIKTDGRVRASGFVFVVG